MLGGTPGSKPVASAVAGFRGGVWQRVGASRTRYQISVEILSATSMGLESPRPSKAGVQNMTTRFVLDSAVRKR